MTFSGWKGCAFRSGTNCARKRAACLNGAGDEFDLPWRGELCEPLILRLDRTRGARPSSRRRASADRIPHGREQIFSSGNLDGLFCLLVGPLDEFLRQVVEKLGGVTRHHLAVLFAPKAVCD